MTRLSGRQGVIALFTTGRVGWIYNTIDHHIPKNGKTHGAAKYTEGT